MGFFRAQPVRKWGMTWTMPFAILFMLGLLLLLGYFFSKKVFPPPGENHSGQEDPSREIPCHNCGQEGCGGFAKALLRGGQEEEIAAPACRHRPQGTPVLVRCRGRNVAPRYHYTGASTCRDAASLPVRPKTCNHSCLGYGDCVTVCAEKAISVASGVAVVNTDRCNGCGDCVEACPVGLIVPAAEPPALAIICSEAQNPEGDRPCPDGCTACGDCERACPRGALSVPPGGLPVWDAMLCDACGNCVEACPHSVLTLLPGSGPKGPLCDGQT